jgi:hypothetical protein
VSERVCVSECVSDFDAAAALLSKINPGTMQDVRGFPRVPAPLRPCAPARRVKPLQKTRDAAGISHHAMPAGLSASAGAAYPALQRKPSCG